MKPIRQFGSTHASALIVSTLLLGGCSMFNAPSNNFSEQATMQRQQTEQEAPTLDNKSVYLDMIKKLQDKSMYFASLAHIDAYQKSYGNAPEVQLLRANALRETGQQAQAETQYRQLLQTSEAGAAWHGLGLLAARQGDFRGAVSAFREAARLEPTNATVLSDLGYALLQIGDPQSARLPLMQAAELAPDNRKVISNLALFLMLSGDHEKARAVMTQAKISDDVSREIFKQAAEIDRKNGKPAAGDNEPSRPVALALNADGSMQLQLQKNLLLPSPD